MSVVPIAERRDRVLEILLFSGDVVRFRNFEVVQVVRHRYLLMHYGLAAMVITLMDIRSGDYNLNLVEFMQTVAASLAAAVLILIVVPILGLVTLCRNGGVLRIRASILLFGAVMTGVISGQITLFLITGNRPNGLPALLAMLVFFYLLGEVIYHYVLLVVVPRVLRDIRGDEPEAVGMVDGDGPIVIKGERFAPEALCCIRADGNYILVRTQDRRVLLPGPFGPVADGLPSDLGMRVSRSDWVARAAVARVHRKGRDVTLDLVEGTSVKVAQVRRKAVLDWIKATGQGGASSEGEAMSIQTG